VPPFPQWDVPSPLTTVRPPWWSTWFVNQPPVEITGGKGQCPHLEHCEYIVNTWTVFQPYTQWVCGDYILSDSYQCTCSLPAQLFLRTFSVFLGCTMCIQPLVHLEFLHSVPTRDTAIISLWYIHSSLFQFSNPILWVCKSGLHSKFPLPVFIACSLCVLY